MTASIVRFWAGTWLILSVGAGPLHAGDVPRYELKPGQVLTYEDEQTYKGKSENSTYKTTWRLWVVGRNDDGSWRIVARTAMKSQPGREDVTFARFDLRPTARSRRARRSARTSIPRRSSLACLATRSRSPPAGRPATIATTRRSATRR